MPRQMRQEVKAETVRHARAQAQAVSAGDGWRDCLSRRRLQYCSHDDPSSQCWSMTTRQGYDADMPVVVTPHARRVQLARLTKRKQSATSWRRKKRPWHDAAQSLTNNARCECNAGGLSSAGLLEPWVRAMLVPSLLHSLARSLSHSSTHARTHSLSHPPTRPALSTAHRPHRRPPRLCTRSSRRCPSSRPSAPPPARRLPGFAVS